MKKFLKKTLIILLAFTMMISISTTTFANKDENIVEEIESPDTSDPSMIIIYFFGCIVSFVALYKLKKEDFE